MYSLRQGLVQCPITALSIYTTRDNQVFVLAGEDAWLKVYAVHSTQCHKFRGQLRVFAEQPIHGISVSPAGSCLVWGGRSVTVVSKEAVGALIRDGGQELEAPLEATAPDWIFDGRISPHGPERGVLVTAHNEILPFEVMLDQRKRQKLVFKDMASPSRPILYSAAVEWRAPDTVLVAAGTVFGEIVVWTWRVDSGSEALVVCLLTGHEGSIFGVALCTDVELEGGQKQQWLASCSDDRTIRIWDVTERSGASTAPDKRERENEARETGFGENYNSEEQTSTNALGPASSERCVAVAMGHVSRIWHVKFENKRTGPIEVLSFGEDTTVQRWHLIPGCGNGAGSRASPKTTIPSDLRYPYSLKHVDKISCHNGKHIWSAAVESRLSRPTLTVTGGADAMVSMLKGKDPEAFLEWTGSADNNITLSWEDFLRSLPDSNSTHVEALDTSKLKSGRDGFLGYAFLSADRMLVSTNSGRLFLGHSRDGMSWTEVAVSDATRHDLKSHSIVKALAPGSAIIGSASGRLYVFREAQGLEEISHLQGKITDVLCIPSIYGHFEDRMVLVTTLGTNQVNIFIFNMGLPNSVVRFRPLALHPGFIVTSVGVCGDLLLLGSRKGIITVYSATDDGYVQKTHRNDCKTKGGDAITSIVTLPPLPGAEPKYVLTTCRDGKYRIYELRSSDSGLSLQLIHETMPPLGPMLEGARLVRSASGEPELVIHGFRSTDFVVWNESRQLEMASVHCGGAHRAFDYFADPSDEGKFCFVYTKASAMGIYWQNSPPLEVIRPGGHGREIRAVSYNSIHGYVATGAEDTCIRIWDRINDSKSTRADHMRCLAVLQKHNAGIQALKWVGAEQLLSSAGAEEFFVWRVSRLESQYRGLAVVCEGPLRDRSKDDYLRVTDFDAIQSPLHVGCGIVITMALSNSTLRTYNYASPADVKVTQRGKYTGACLTQVRHLQVFDGDRLTVLTASTDGYIVVWKTGKTSADDAKGYQIVLRQRVHANSVKSLHAISVGGQGVLWQVFTGGDDNALCVMTVTGDLPAAVDGKDDAAFRVTRAIRCKDAHTAAINAVQVVRVDERFVYLASASNDQRLKLWRVEKHPSEALPVRLALLQSIYSAVADPGGLELLAGSQLMVVGVGMELWSGNWA